MIVQHIPTHALRAGSRDAESIHLDGHCFSCRGTGFYWEDSTGEPRSCDENHPSAERCHCGCGVERCVGCKARLYVIEVTAEEGAYCIACAARLAPVCSGCGAVREIVVSVGPNEEYCAGCALQLTCHVIDTVGFEFVEETP